MGPVPTIIYFPDRSTWFPVLRIPQVPEAESFPPTNFHKIDYRFFFNRIISYIDIQGSVGITLSMVPVDIIPIKAGAFPAFLLHSSISYSHNLINTHFAPLTGTLGTQTASNTLEGFCFTMIIHVSVGQFPHRRDSDTGLLIPQCSYPW